MKILLSWLKDYIDIQETPEKIADGLTMSGLEVEGIDQPAKGLDGVVVGKILTKERHPNADKLSVCTVDIGEKEPLTIVCGAQNMKAGDKVPVATLGAHLPSGFEISKAKIRGVESFGMMCSKKELSLGEDHSGLLILDENAQIGQNIVETLNLDDVVFDINVTPNRGDALSHLGAARELSAIFNVPLHREPLGADDGEDNISNFISVEIKDSELCPRYGARLVRGVKVASSPEWLKNRLEKVGVRSINNVVDITNYIMLDIGHPMHAFDYDKIEGKKIIVRQAEPHEKIIALDGIERSLDSNAVVIANASSAMAIAGVMGGEGYSVSDKTTNVLLEGAVFNPVSIRKTAKKLAMTSESSYRFERGVNIDNVPIALNQAAKMLSELAEGKCVKGICDCCPKNEPIKQIRVRTKRLNKLIGINLSATQIETFLARLKFETKKDGENLIVSVPPYRNDIEQEADIAEEVARIYGYNNIPDTLPAITSVLQLPTALQRISKRLEDHLVSCGFTQLVTYSFVPQSINPSFNEKKPMLLKNPLSEELNAMRTSLKYNMLDAIKRNVLNDEFSMRFFEIANVFHELAGGVIDERTRLCIGVCGPKNPLDWKRSSEVYDLFSVKGIVEAIAKLLKLKLRFALGTNSIFHPAWQLDISIGKQKAGELGKLHPQFIDNKKIPSDIFLIELDLSTIAEHEEAVVKAKPIAEFPAVRRDLALLAPENVLNRDILKILNGEGKDLLEDCSLFDVYTGKGIETGFRSLAYSLSFRDMKKTLTDAEVQPIIDKIISRLDKELSVKLR